MLHHFEKLAAFAAVGKPFAELYRLFERHAFRECARLRAQQAIDSWNDLGENGYQLIYFYSTSDRAVTGSFGDR
jgi:hypothetical protein